MMTKQDRIMGADWWLQHRKILMSTNARRLATGTLCGAGLTYAYFYVFRFLLKGSVAK